MAVSHSYRSGEPRTSFSHSEEFVEHTADDSDEEFRDADDKLMEYDPDFVIFEKSLEVSSVALKKFFNNDIEEARLLLEPGCKTLMYHALGMSIIELIPAVLTFDRAQIHKAMQALKETIALCDRSRRTHGLMQTLLNRYDYDSYTDKEAHAELVHGEALLLHSMLSFLEDEDLTALIRGTINIKSCYNSYKFVEKILQSNKAWSSRNSEHNFVSGVMMGLGTFNLLISLLPPKVIMLLQIVGFPADKTKGINMLVEGSAKPGLRKHMCQLMLLAYNTIVCHYNGKIGDLEQSRNIVSELTELYPQGVWFKIFSGRLEFIDGNYDAAIRCYRSVITGRAVWRQVHHMCYWELMWIHCARSEWRIASNYLAILVDQSAWSKTIYLYFRAAMLLQETTITEQEKKMCAEMMSEAPKYQQRIAGKSLPMEKFAARRCYRFFSQDNKLVVPALEVMCLWNVFETMANNTDAGSDVLEITQKMIGQLSEVARWEGDFAEDNTALVYYIHGCALRHMGKIQDAIDALEKARKNRVHVKEDFFINPYAIVELAFCHFELKDDEKGIELLNHAKKFKNYALESRLHFRIHNKLQELNEKHARN